MTLTKYIRKLARSSYWQNIYRASKKCANISLFINNSEHSDLQSTFLYWLKIYDMLYIELSKKEWTFLTEEVIKNDYRRSEEHTSELQSHSFISYAVFCL